MISKDKAFKLKWGGSGSSELSTTLVLANPLDAAGVERQEGDWPKHRACAQVGVLFLALLRNCSKTSGEIF